MLTARRAWGVLIGAIVLYEVACEPDELMTRGIQRATVEHPIAVRAAIGVTALHLLGVLPGAVDPFRFLHGAGALLRRSH